jgi:acetylglutamate kinase
MKNHNLSTIPEEFEKYLTKFEEAKYFAAIKAGGECLNDSLAHSLRILYGLGLYPLVVHGGGRQIDEALESQGIASKKINGKRVTDKRTLEVVVETLTRVNREFGSKVNQLGNCAEMLNGVFYVDGLDPVYGYVGNVIGINKEKIDNCIGKRLITIISCIGVNGKGQYRNLNADSAYKFLVSELRPVKVIILTSKGGVYRNTELIPEMKEEELDRFLKSSYVDGGMKLKLEEAKELVVRGFDVQITNPEHLIEELFSDKGYGTYLHRRESRAF